MTSDTSDPKWEAKIDHRIRALLAGNQRDADSASQIVNVFVRFIGSPESLRAQGLMLRTIAGDIATASIHLSDIPRVAMSPQILCIELSQGLGPDSR